MENRAAWQTEFIDRIAQGFARHSINQKTAAPTQITYEGSQKRKITPPVNQKPGANRGRQSKIEYEIQPD